MAIVIYNRQNLGPDVTELLKTVKRNKKVTRLI